MVLNSNYSYLANKRVLITGTSGTVGRSILNFIANLNTPPSLIIAVDNNESGQFELEQSYKGKSVLNAVVLDIRSEADLNYYFRGVDIVFHCAALKHVIMCERSPEQAVASNILGVLNVIRAAQKQDIERCIFTSSDKAVNPTNVMGTSKLMGERLITATNASEFRTKFSSTRFGNVLGSNGSVLPIFKRQILTQKKVTVTSLEMTRFVMSLEDATSLVVNSGGLARGGEIFITKMPVIKIINLALALLKHFKGLEESEAMENIKIIGAKPGEKLYEELMTEEECPRALELSDYFIVKPYSSLFDSEASPDYPGANQIDRVYNSQNQHALSIDGTLNFLKSHNLLEPYEVGEEKRVWPR
jgi:FlaA1/EpsC-like NDP-sugar epimerase